MKIGIDARLYSQTGVGRYIRNLIRVLGEIDKENNYVVLLAKENAKNFLPPNNRWKVKIVNIRWHSFLEQVLMPVFLYKEKLDLFHFPYFNVPILYFKPFVVTIHDLTHLHFDTGRASQLPWIIYKVKRCGLKIALWWAINKSKKIIAVSEATKREIIDHYGVIPDKVIVTYEGVESQKSNLRPELRSREVKSQKHKLKVKNLGKYLLYIGNAYPHKNLERVIRGVGDIKLVLVGPDDFFYKRLKDFVKERKLDKQVIFYGPANDSELAVLYRNAACLIIPSLMEGFGLTALEAMSQGCLVLASDIPALREICGEAAVYFNPLNFEEIKEKILWVIRGIREEIGKKRGLGEILAKKFSWEKMGRETLKLYQQVIK